mmetsp:Transcript_5605/g.13362  ORF Transcript_5605/g.13362 Transcript_5605/m.13362 type:complete len:259 (+) Transcript_5605:571-1347(+)
MPCAPCLPLDRLCEPTNRCKNQTHKLKRGRKNAQTHSFASHAPCVYVYEYTLTYIHMQCSLLVFHPALTDTDICHSFIHSRFGAAAFPKESEQPAAPLGCIWVLLVVFHEHVGREGWLGIDELLRPPDKGTVDGYQRREARGGREIHIVVVVLILVAHGRDLRHLSVHDVPQVRQRCSSKALTQFGNISAGLLDVRHSHAVSFLLPLGHGDVFPAYGPVERRAPLQMDDQPSTDTLRHTSECCECLVRKVSHTEGDFA